MYLFIFHSRKIFRLNIEELLLNWKHDLEGMTGELQVVQFYKDTTCLGWDSSKFPSLRMWLFCGMSNSNMYVK